VPADFIAAVPSPREVRLRVTQQEARSTRSSLGATVPQQEDAQIRIPLFEERLVLSARDAEQGELLVHKSVDEREEILTQAVTRDDLEIERVPVGRDLIEPAKTHREGEWLVIPIMEEVPVVHKQLRLKEEVRIRTRQVVTDQEVRETVRRERVEIEDATVHGMANLPEDLVRQKKRTQTKEQRR